MTFSDLATVIILGVAAYRLTRFLVIDSLLEPGRTNLHNALARHDGAIWAKIHELVSCTWCVGVYVSIGIYAFFVGDLFIDWTRADFISAIAVAGIQGMLHAVEPDEM